MPLIFNATTVQSGVFKTLVEAVKEIITDGNIVIDENGMSLSAMDTSQTVLVSLHLDAANFEVYACERRQIIGLNFHNFFKLIKTMTNTDTLTMFIEAENPNVIGLRIENSEKRSMTIYKLNLLDINEDEISLPPATFESMITMPSVDFQKFIRDMSQIGDVVDIKSVGQQLILSCKGDFCSQETVIGEAGGNGFSMKNDDKELIVQAKFALKYLVLFTKCTNLSSQCECYLKTDFPLVMSYSVANLGVIKLLLAPHKDHAHNRRAEQSK